MIYKKSIQESEFLNNIKIADKSFELMGIINHLGPTMDQGHYTTYFKTDEKLYLFDDSSYMIKAPKLTTSDSYIILFKNNNFQINSPTTHQV